MTITALTDGIYQTDIIVNGQTEGSFNTDQDGTDYNVNASIVNERDTFTIDGSWTLRSIDNYNDNENVEGEATIFDIENAPTDFDWEFTVNTDNAQIGTDTEIRVVKNGNTVFDTSQTDNTTKTYSGSAVQGDDVSAYAQTGLSSEGGTSVGGSKTLTFMLPSQAAISIDSVTQDV